ncbi:unnamed protein product [Eretmochelys imbricata]
MEIQMQPVCGVCILDPAEKVELQDSAWRRGSYRMADGEIDLRSDPLSRTAEVSNELPASHKVRRLRLEAAAPYYYDCQLQVEVQWKKGKESHKVSSTYLLKWKPIVCVANRTAAEEKAAVQEQSFVILKELKPSTTYQTDIQVLSATGHGQPHGKPFKHQRLKLQANKVTA